MSPESLAQARQRNIQDALQEDIGPCDWTAQLIAPNTQAEATLQGQEWSEALLQRAVEAGCTALEPRQDLNASADFRRHLARMLMEQTLKTAWERTGGAAG